MSHDVPPRYRVLRLLGKSGYCEVALARDEALGREVALKRIQDPFAENAESTSRLLREAEITSQLQHPGILPVFDLLTTPEGRPAFVMPIVHGMCLHDAIGRFHQADKQPRRDASERSLALRGLLTRYVAVCNAVAYAHSRGVIHRDLKSANVMLGEYGETFVVDWGLARVLDPDKEDETTPATPLGLVLGTPAYMPPEQARGEHDQVGPASDVFALGATLYEILTGKPPYSGSDALEKATRGDFAPPRQVQPSVPRALEAVCLKAMAAEPVLRYRTVRELAQDVDYWLADEPVSAYRERVVGRVRRWGRRHRTLVSTATALLLAGVVGLGLGLWALNVEKAKAKANLEQAEENLELAKCAVDECFNVAKDHPLFQMPGMEKARKLLLTKTLPFYERFRQGKPDE